MGDSDGGDRRRRDHGRLDRRPGSRFRPGPDRRLHPEWPDGTIVAPGELEHVGVDAREQVAAVRWWTGTGQVHQVFVAPHMRRRRIGTKLVLTGAALTVGRRWPSLWSGGELTDLGTSWVSASVWAARVAPRSQVVPPMTPEEG